MVNERGGGASTQQYRLQHALLTTGGCRSQNDKNNVVCAAFCDVSRVTNPPSSHRSR